MPGNANITAEEITRLTTLRDAIVKTLNWRTGVSGTYEFYDWLNTATFDMENDTLPSMVSWTGTGYTGWWAEWRTNNPSVTSGDLYDTWNYELNGAGTGNGIVSDDDGHHAAVTTTSQAALDSVNADLAYCIANAA